MMNFEQIKGITERILTVAVAFVVGKGWITQAMSADVIAVILLLMSVAWGFYQNSPNVLADAAKVTAPTPPAA